MPLRHPYCPELQRTPTSCACRRIRDDPKSEASARAYGVVVLAVLDPDPNHERWMQLALAQARAAGAAGDVPIGAVVVHLSEDGPRVVAERHNEREASGDPTAHAEVLALRDAARALGRWRLDDCVMAVTLEPCPMCAGALWASRIAGVVSGAENHDAGALGTLYHFGQDPRLNHEFPVRSKVLDEECAGLLREFFADRR